MSVPTEDENPDQFRLCNPDGLHEVLPENNIVSESKGNYELFHLFHAFPVFQLLHNHASYFRNLF